VLDNCSVKQFFSNAMKMVRSSVTGVRRVIFSPAWDDRVVVGNIWGASISRWNLN
jgi:hypothetical protein